MIRAHFFASLVITVLVVLLVSSCVSPGNELNDTPYVNSVKMNKGTMLSPDEGTLLFGHIFREGLLGYAPIMATEFIQLDPAQEPACYSPGKSGTVFYLAPVKPGVTAHLISWHYSSGNTVYYGVPGLKDSNMAITVTAKNAGLQYVGAHQFINPVYESKTITNQLLGFHRVDSPTELEALQKIAPLLAGTVWEEVIASRIEELTNE